MTIKISINQKDFLINNCLMDDKDLIKLISNGKEIYDNWEIEATKELFDDLRDLCSDKLQEIGFDENYELTEDGKILQDLIDLFYIK